MQTDDEIYRLLGTGTWRDFLPKVPKPVVALFGRELYRVFLEGSDFVLPIEGSDPARGFFTTRYVAVASIREAKKTAINVVVREWRRKGFARLSGTIPSLRIVEIALLGERFRLRAGVGFSFYCDASGT